MVSVHPDDSDPTKSAVTSVRNRMRMSSKLPSGSRGSDSRVSGPYRRSGDQRPEYGSASMCDCSVRDTSEKKSYPVRASSASTVTT